MKFATIKALVEEENKPMYAAVVLSDDIFPFELSEKERTCVFLVEPERDQYTVSCDGRIFRLNVFSLPTMRTCSSSASRSFLQHETPDEFSVLHQHFGCSG